MGNENNTVGIVLAVAAVVISLIAVGMVYFNEGPTVDLSQIEGSVSRLNNDIISMKSTVEQNTQSLAGFDKKFTDKTNSLQNQITNAGSLDVNQDIADLNDAIECVQDSIESRSVLNSNNETITIHVIDDDEFDDCLDDI